MKKNMGAIDRMIRTTIAIVLIILVATGKIDGTVAIIISILAAVFLLTSLVGFCPAYAPLGISTLRKKLHKKTN
jgi:hypothetical protein